MTQPWLQVHFIDGVVHETTASIEELQQRIAEIAPADLIDTPARPARSAGGGRRAGRTALGGGGTAKRGRTAKGGADASAAAAAVAVVAPPPPLPVPPHFRPFTFHLPGREPFSVRARTSAAERGTVVLGC